MSRDVLTVGSTMRIPLLYRGEYSQWSERFMNYLEEQTDGEAMINSINNIDQPLPRVTQVSIAGTSSTEQPPLKDKSMCNKTTKGLWDALARHMLGSEYGEQDRKADDKKVEKKDDEKKRDMSKLKCYNCKKEGQFAKDCKKAKVKDYEYYKTKMFLAKKDKDEQVLLAEDHAWMKSSSDSDQEINANMVFMAQIEKVLSDSEASLSSSDDKISKVSYYLSESESESEYKTLEYYDNTTTYGLFVNDNDDQEIFHDWENFPENLIESQIDHNESVVDHNDSEGIDKLIRKFNKMIAKCLKRNEKANQQNKDFRNQNKDLQDKYDVLKNQATTFEMKNKELNEQMKVLIEKNDDLLAQTNALKDELQAKHVVIDTHVICQEKYAKLKAERYEYMIRYSACFDNNKQHRKQIADQEVLYNKMSVQLVELDKHIKDLKNTVLEKDFKIFELEECVRNKDLEIEKCLERLNDCENKPHKMGQTNQTVHMIMPSKDKMYNGRKGIGFENPSYFYEAKDLRPTLYDDRVINLGEENLNVIAPGMFKLRVSQSVSPISVTKMSCGSNDVENLDTLSSVRRPKPSGVMWMRKWLSNTVKDDLSFVNHSILNKNVKRYSRKNLMESNNSDIRSAFDCNNARNALSNARMNASVDVNDLFVFDDVSIRKSHVSKMPFRKKPSAFLNAPSRSKLKKSLPRIVRKWLPKLQLLSIFMMGNRALLTNFIEKFLGTVHFGNNDFAVIAGYGDVVIGSMTIKKVYYVEGLGHNLFSVGKFSDKGLEV
nr:integrase, catalytic region, zinc finger, CCHC-type, peptidase aspartic, catalytic [Tanacetum cinerariifolium]